MLHMICARCVACDLHMIAPRPLERMCWRRFTAQLGDYKKSRTVPLNAIIIIRVFLGVCVRISLQRYEPVVELRCHIFSVH